MFHTQYTMSAVIGIAFGNTSSSIAVANADGKVDVIANPDGDRSIPSVLSYVGEDEYHGAQAKAQLVRNPQNTITNFRDYIGKSFDELHHHESVGAAVKANANGEPAFEVARDDGKTETVTVHEATKRHLLQMKSAAEDYIGKQIEGVVMTVPTDFTTQQRDALKAILAEAGLKVLQLINEPSAALLAHLSSEPERFKQDKIYVVADFGGVRSDAAVIAVRGGIFTVLATAHEHGLGGDKLDAALAEFFAKEFEKKYKANPRVQPRLRAKLNAEAVVVKKTLSNVQTSTCLIESLADGFDFHTTINRLRYELTARSVLLEMTAFVERVVGKAQLDPLDIDEVLLVGGTSHTPKLASNVAFIFPESTVVTAPALVGKAVDPAELTCRGAALQASLIETFDEEEIKELLQPVVVNTQHLAKPIGFKDADGKFVSVLVAETAYPIKKLVEVSNGDAVAVVVELYEGQRTVKETVVERAAASDDSDSDSDDEPEVKRLVVYECGQLLLELALKDLKPHSKLEVAINITQNGTLHVSGRELKPGAVAVKGEIAA